MRFAPISSRSHPRRLWRRSAHRPLQSAAGSCAQRSLTPRPAASAVMATAPRGARMRKLRAFGRAATRFDRVGKRANRIPYTDGVSGAELFREREAREGCRAMAQGRDVGVPRCMDYHLGILDHDQPSPIVTGPRIDRWDRRPRATSCKAADANTVLVKLHHGTRARSAQVSSSPSASMNAVRYAGSVMTLSGPRIPHRCPMSAWGQKAT